MTHVKEKLCQAAVCRELVDYVIDPEKCNGCQLCVDICPTDAISGAKSELHSIDLYRCIKCKACYEVCRFNPLAGNAITIKSKQSVS